ncbi:hypothetical protein [Natronosalvus halobius]|uniref:hypothetical protein n=1 Tax=Natronosalvus halobius TaxID=2953746 RepID=UPI0020A1238C|nr:hypothetical protein [Natronosalvus halobius]USZ71096.1 hypothetical protein NGM15_13520 [Natronosalvus halobius]
MASAELRRDGARFDEKTYSGKKSEIDTSTFKSTLEIALTPWRGSLTTITVEDVHENIGTETLYYKHPYAVKLATELNSPEEAGVLTGVTMGAAELPDFFRLVREEPHEMAMVMAEFIGEMNRAAVDPRRNPWVEIAKDLPPSIYHDQQQANPYPAPSSDPLESFSTCLGTLGYSDGDHLGLSEDEFTHCQFANGWYSGYSAFLVIETVVGDKGLSKGATSASDVATQLRRASDDLESVLPAVRSGQSMRTTQISHRLLTDGGRQLDDLSPQFRTAGKTAQGVKRFEAVDQRTLNRLDSSQRTELLHHLADAPNGHRVINDLGLHRTEQLFRLSYDGVDTVQFRANILQHGDAISQPRLNQYIDDATTARSHATIRNPEGPVVEAAREGIAPSQIRGQAGEAKSAVRYADEGADVTVEPGKGDYDLAVIRDGRTEYVEVKTPAVGTSINRNYWLRQTESMNKKFDNTDDLARKDAVLEVQTTRGISQLDDAVSELNELVETPGITTNFGEIRIHSTNADTRIVKIDSV